MLRHYDEVGMLRPAHTDKRNGYRFYTATQRAELNRILVLRELGLSLEQISHRAAAHARLAGASQAAAIFGGMIGNPGARSPSK
jgi:DNA-binding transcriptional MerR regulator